MKSNIALVKRNASIGSDIAIAIFDQVHANSRKTLEWVDNSEKKAVVMGGAVVDLIAKPDSSLIMGSSSPGYVTESNGGMFINIFFSLG